MRVRALPGKPVSTCHERCVRNLASEWAGACARCGGCLIGLKPVSKPLLVSVCASVLQQHVLSLGLCETECLYQMRARWVFGGCLTLGAAWWSLLLRHCATVPGRLGKFDGSCGVLELHEFRMGIGGLVVGGWRVACRVSRVA